jgi:DNA-binding transcriptional ArsR family regulator
MDTNCSPDPDRRPEPDASGTGTVPGTAPSDHAAGLKARDQWVCAQNRAAGRGRKPRKVPVDPADPNGPGIDHTDPNKWMPYEEAKRHHEEDVLIDHYGFATHEGDPYAFIDIDECVDEETGELSRVVLKLLEHLDSYAYYTPNLGVRIVVRGELGGTGGDYVWTDPDTGEEHVFEVYDNKRYLVFTDWVCHDAPIRGAQAFLDSLVKKKGRSGRNAAGRRIEAFNFPEVALPEDLEEARRKVKHLFAKHDLDPGPIREGSRKRTLISYFRTVVRNQPVETGGEPDTEANELWTFINWANETMLYDERGEHLEGLDREEVEEVYEAVLRDLPEKAPREVQEKLDELWKFLVTIRVKIGYRLDSRWKVVKAFQEHGRKYGALLSEHEVRVDFGWLALQKQARIGSRKTLGKALANLRSAGIIRNGRDKGDRTGHFVVDLDKAMNTSYWGIEEEERTSHKMEITPSYEMEEERNPEEEGLYARVNKSETPPHHTCLPLHKAVERVPKEVLEALTHTTWYRQAGPTKIRYLLAIAIINWVLGEGATSTRIAEAVGVRPSSVSRPLRELREAGVVHQDAPRGPYKVDEMVAEDLYWFRSQRGEFHRDWVAKRKARDQRLFYGYQMELKDAILGFLGEGSDPEHALEEARKTTRLPKGMKEHERYKRQEWALGQARSEHERSRDGSRPKRAGRARGADGDARVLRDMREGYFRGKGKNQDG